jgi:hypothetical protein
VLPLKHSFEQITTEIGHTGRDGNGSGFGLGCARL